MATSSLPPFPAYLRFNAVTAYLRFSAVSILSIQPHFYITSKWCPKFTHTYDLVNNNAIDQAEQGTETGD